ncbi:endonuclease III [Bacteroidota bacterium]
MKDKKTRLASIIRIMSKEYPNAGITLRHKNPFDLLVATILSAQCRDKRVNIVTKSLFAKYKTPEDYLEVHREELEKDIYSTGFYKAKAKSIRGSAINILQDYNGKVPGTMKELLTLPGVGRKTANVILGHCFKPEGIVVDTHVIRISNRLGLVSTKNPEIIEHKLIELVPKSKWMIFTHYLINHGRNVCTARKPKCENCRISKHCPASTN